MGMAASQARFLSLTARKNNVEFEGQQINQQRTTLSNESASYYSQLCNMEVPTPPSIDDYTKVTYTFNDGAMTNTIISLLPRIDEDGKYVTNKYSLNYVEEWQDDYAIVPGSSSLVQRITSGSDVTYQVGSAKLRPMADITTDVTVAGGSFKSDTYFSATRDGHEFWYKKNTTDGVSVVSRKEDVTVDTSKYQVVADPKDATKAIAYIDSTAPVSVQARDAAGNPVAANATDIDHYTYEKDVEHTIAVLDDWSAIEDTGLVTWDTSHEPVSINIPNSDGSLTTYYMFKKTDGTLYKEGDRYCIELNQTDDRGKLIQTYNKLVVDGKAVEDGTASESQRETLAKIKKGKGTIDALNDGSDEYIRTLNDEQKAALLENEKYYLAMLREKLGKEAETFSVRYVKNTTSGNWEPYFYSDEELENADKYNNKDLASIPCYTIGSATKTREILNQTATIEQDASGRYSSVTLIFNEGTEEETSRTYNLVTTTTTDEEAYNDAMNQYTYKQHEYDHKVQEINSKLEVVQQQDKQLELKLKQLDTEENAISTEMDAVKKVISKNVESSFKTFSA